METAVAVEVSPVEARDRLLGFVEGWRRGCRFGGNARRACVRARADRASLSRLHCRPICGPLPPVATARLR